MHDNYTFNVLFMMDMKSIVSSLEKMHYGLDPYDATLNKYLVGLLKYLGDLLYFFNACGYKYIWVPLRYITIGYLLYFDT